ncbi:uncharacterized protein [Nicotiana tomentosiformis]|uniref:uncharacterized protein n=1 Tax=Nicotiana tomentosiformis TaxID=4098 RepID=UPI00388CC3B1
MGDHTFATKLLIPYSPCMVSLTKSRPPITFKQAGKWKSPTRRSRIFISKTVNDNRMDCSKKLDEALWAYRTTYKTPIGMSPYWLVFRKACHLLMELEHKDMWELKKLNFEWDVTANLRVEQLNELDNSGTMHIQLQMFPGKLKSKWSGPFEVMDVTPFGALDLKNKNDEVFRVKGHRTMVRSRGRGDTSKGRGETY